MEKHIYAPVMTFMTVLWFISHEGSQFSKLFCCFLLLLFHIFSFLFCQNPIVSACKVSSVEMSISLMGHIDHASVFLQASMFIQAWHSYSRNSNYFSLGICLALYLLKLFVTQKQCSAVIFWQPFKKTHSQRNIEILYW